MELELALQDEQPKRDLLWEALMSECSIDTKGLTKSARGKYNTALAQLRRVRAEPADVVRRAEMYRLRFPHAPLTPSALCRHWPELRPVRREPSVIVRNGEVWIPGVGWSSL